MNNFIGDIYCYKAYIGNTQISKAYLGTTEVIRDYSKEYFTIESLVDNNNIDIKNVNNNQRPVINFSSDGGSTWSSITPVKNDTVRITTLNAGEKIILKSTAQKFANQWNYYNAFIGSGNFIVYGNIMSLLYNDNFVSNPEFGSNWSLCFAGLFYDSTNLVDAKNLVLPAITLVNSCYNGMFRGCTNLKIAPQLPGQIGAQDSYSSMFEGCINLEKAPAIHLREILGTTCCGRMFCMSRTSTLLTPKMTKSPIIPNMSIIAGAGNPFKEMFKGNGNLTEVTCLIENPHEVDYRFLDWLVNCSPTATFYKNPNATWNRNTNGIPSGWTVIDYTGAIWYQLDEEDTGEPDEPGGGEPDEPIEDEPEEIEEG